MDLMTDYSQCSHSLNALNSSCGIAGGTASQRRKRPTCHVARTRLLSQSVQVLSDGELLSLILRPARSRTSFELGSHLLTRFGGLRALLAADQAVATAHGISESNYASLQAALELAKRHFHELMADRPYVNDPRIAREYVRMRLRDLPHEVFSILFLDGRHRVVHFEELFRGTVDGASVHPREVVKKALEQNASAVIVAHNHPSGLEEPSQADRLVTQRLKAALALVDIRLLDHLIVADGTVLSFAERGLL